MPAWAKNAFGEVKGSLICANGKDYFAAALNLIFSWIREVVNIPRLPRPTLTVGQF